MLDINAVVIGNKAALMASYLVLGYAIGVVDNDVIAIFLNQTLRLTYSNGTE